MSGLAAAVEMSTLLTDCSATCESVVRPEMPVKKLLLCRKNRAHQGCQRACQIGLAHSAAMRISVTALFVTCGSAAQFDSFKIGFALVATETSRTEWCAICESAGCPE